MKFLTDHTLGKKFRMNCIRKYYEMLIFKVLSWFSILLISIMCCLIPLTPLYFIMVNLEINVLASDLFDAINCCSTKVKNSLAFLELWMKPLIFLTILLWMNMRLIRLECSHFSWSVFTSKVLSLVGIGGSSTRRAKSKLK